MRTRTAYIRTLLDKEAEPDYNETDWLNLETWLRFWVGQRVYQDPCSQGKRKGSSPPPDLHHHYILGHTTVADERALDWLIHQSRPDGWRLLRTDFTVYLSQAQADAAANKPLLQRLRREGVAVELVPPPLEDAQAAVEYASEDACDSMMLSTSDYVLETSVLRRYPKFNVFSGYYRDSMRHGRPEQYNKQELSEQYYAGRMARKTGHTLEQGMYLYPKSDAWRRQHAEEWRNYKCPSCGKRCKRSTGCKTTGEQWWVAQDRYSGRLNWAEGVDTSAPRPPDFEKAWRTLSAEDVINSFGPDPVASARFRNWKWASVATFSGE